MSRHVVHVEAKGLPTPSRIRRQRRILAALDGQYRALTRDAGGAPDSGLRPIKSFGFSTRSSREDAVARLVALLDDVDPEWRSYVRVWDGYGTGVRGALRA